MSALLPQLSRSGASKLRQRSRHGIGRYCVARHPASSRRFLNSATPVPSVDAAVFHARRAGLQPARVAVADAKRGTTFRGARILSFRAMTACSSVGSTPACIAATAMAVMSLDKHFPP